jgi:probable rRNA maturation factor
VGSRELVVVVNAPSDASASPERIEEAVRHTVADAGLERGEISITLLDDDEIRSMNLRYLDRDRPTDVIAFSLGEPEQPLGDVYIGYRQAARNAETHGVAASEEELRLAIHGVLHVLGHDHPEGEDRLESPMFELQERLLAEVSER